MAKERDKQCIVDVLGKPYLVEYKTNYESNNKMGFTSVPDQRITVNKTIGAQQKDDTLLHEVLHVIDIELALGFTEETIRRLAVGLTSAGCRCKKR